jgi:UDP-glucose 4-epimerase
MSRVLVTGGAGAIGGAIVRRLLADPAYEVRVSDRRAAPQWMREGAEVHDGDLRVAREARAALDGCTHVIHLAGLGDGDPNGKEGLEESVAADARRTPFALMETIGARYSTVIGAAVEPSVEVERFVYVSSAAVFERASEFPTSEAHLAECPAPKSPYGFAMLAGERYCRAAYEEHGLKYTICRPCDVYGPGIALETRGSAGQTRTPTHVDDVASGVLAAMGSPKGANEDFNIAATRELTVAEIARIVWETCGEDAEALATEPPPTATNTAIDTATNTAIDTNTNPDTATESLPKDTSEAQRSWPSVEKAQRLLGWKAQIGVEEGIAATVEWIRARGSVGSAP